MTKPVSTMSKDELRDYAQEKHNVTFAAGDMRIGVDKLRDRVSKLDSDVAAKQKEDLAVVNQPEQATVEAEPEAEPEAKAPPVRQQKPAPVTDSKAGFVMNPANGNIYHADGEMAKHHPEWKPCNREGKLL